VRTNLATLVTIVTFALTIVGWPAPSTAGTPCCAITAIDAKTQTVTARETKTGRTFQFKVLDARILGALQVGQAVHADFKTMKVSLSPDGVQPCCAVVNLRTPTR
jgi:hypothetical protein